MDISLDHRVSNLFEILAGSHEDATGVRALDENGFDLEHAFDIMPDLGDFGYSVDELASTRITLSSDTPVGTYTLELTGSGLSPVGSLQQLLDAIDGGMASGAFSQVVLSGPTSANGPVSPLLTLTTTQTGYTLTSGGQSLIISGALPSSLSQFSQWADAIDLLDRLDTLSPAEEAQLSSILQSYDISGLEMQNGGNTVFSLGFGANQITFGIEGYTVEFNGTFPDNFMQLLDVVLNVADIEDMFGMVSSLEQIDGLALDSIDFTGPGGVALGSVVGPLTDGESVEADSFTIDGVAIIQNGVQVREVLTGGDNPDAVAFDHNNNPIPQPYVDSIEDVDYADWPNLTSGDGVLFGLGGDDNLNGSDGNDRLYGGTGTDNLIGGAGNDYLNPGAGMMSEGDYIATGLGNDTVDMTDVENHWVFLDYNDLGWNPITQMTDVATTGISAQVNGVANTGSVDEGPTGTDTLIDVDNPMRGGGLDIWGTQFDDSFTYTVTDGQWISAYGQDGIDSYNFNFQNGGIIRLNMHNRNTQAVSINLENGQILNDGFGNSETINVTGNGTVSIRTSHLDDTVIGSNGDDRFILRGGNDTLDGLGGIDMLRYDRSGVEAVNVDLEAGTATGIWSGNAFSHSFTSIENVRGSRDDADTLRGSSVANLIEGRGGDDTLIGLAGDDTLYGGWGDDSKDGGAGNDVAFYSIARAGSTITNYGAYVVVQSSQGNDTLTGIEQIEFSDQTVSVASLPVEVGTPTPGDDVLVGTAAAEQISGFAGDDRVLGLGGADTLYGGPGSDTLEGGDGNDLLGGSAGNDRLLGGGGDDRAFTAAGDDTAYGGDGDDVLGGAGGDDLLVGELGADALWGSDGNDTLLGGAGADTLGGSVGNDSLDGGDAADALWGSAGNDTLLGGAGNDTLGGADGTDSLVGGTGNDELWGAAGNDTLSGGDGDDRIGAGTQDDRVSGGAGNDEIFGGLGHDMLRGDAGNDTLFGAGGDDVIDGGAGNDEMYAGPGADVIVFSGGSDTALFFSAADDRVDLSGVGAISDFADLQANHLTEVGGSAVIDDGAGNALTLQNIAIASLGADDFIF